MFVQNFFLFNKQQINRMTHHKSHCERNVHRFVAEAMERSKGITVRASVMEQVAAQILQIGQNDALNPSQFSLGAMNVTLWECHIVVDKKFYVPPEIIDRWYSIGIAPYH